MRIAVVAAGAFADPEIIPFLIEQMKVPKLARAAGESFSLITGANIAYEDLDGEKPKGFETGPTENPDDENVAMDSDLNLPWPDPRSSRSGGTRPGQFRQGHPVPAGPAHHPGVPSRSPQDRLPAQACRRSPGVGHPQARPPPLRSPRPGWRQQTLL